MEHAAARGGEEIFSHALNDRSRTQELGITPILSSESDDEREDQGLKPGVEQDGAVAAPHTVPSFSTECLPAQDVANTMGTKQVGASVALPPNPAKANPSSHPEVSEGLPDQESFPGTSGQDFGLPSDGDFPFGTSSFFSVFTSNGSFASQGHDARSNPETQVPQDTPKDYVDPDEAFGSLYELAMPRDQAFIVQAYNHQDITGREFLDIGQTETTFYQDHGFIPRNHGSYVRDTRHHGRAHSMPWMQTYPPPVP